MPYRSFFATYTLTGSFFLIAQIMIASRLYPNWTADHGRAIVNALSAEAASMPEFMKGVLATFAIALAIFLILSSGFFLDLFSSIYQGDNISIIAANLRRHGSWLNQWASDEKLFLQDDVRKVLRTGRSRFIRRRLAKRKTLVGKSLAVVGTLLNLKYQSQIDKVRRAAIAPCRRIHDLLAANVAGMPSNTRVDIYIERTNFWQTASALSTSITLLTLQTVVVLFIQMIPTMKMWGDKPDLIAIGKLVGVEICGLLLATAITRSAYRRLFQEILALNYIIWKRGR